LILTEGDSAKTFAVSGLGVIGRDNYGVFPLKGKPLNVRDAKAEKVTKNDEISAITKIMGLKHGKTYTKENLKELRYGSLMLMADQGKNKNKIDYDGSHIKGLIINYIHKFWPKLLEIQGFLKEFITPIVKVTPKKKSEKSLTFFTIPEYEEWKTEHEDKLKLYTIKYYKGLGTSSAKEAKEYFSNFKIHQCIFKWEGESSGTLIEMAFSKDKTLERKEWLNKFEEGTYLDHSKKYIKYSDFFNKELILFSRYDCDRSIPSIVDGLKPGQRKILFGCFKRKLKREIKVSQLVGK
jgi:DNA topoisomerase II